MKENDEQRSHLGGFAEDVGDLLLGQTLSVPLEAGDQVGDGSSGAELHDEPELILFPFVGPGSLEEEAVKGRDVGVEAQIPQDQKFLLHFFDVIRNGFHNLDGNAVAFDINKRKE